MDIQSNIIAAIIINDINTVSSLISKDKSIINKVIKSKCTPLMMSCYSNNIQIAQLLLSNNANANI